MPCTAYCGEGTSFATAVVTGAAAQLWTMYPDLSADEVRKILLGSARTVGGWQVLDLEAVLAWEEKAAPVCSDVAGGAYYYDTVLWACEQKITGGTTAATFSPDSHCTRAQMVTFLCRYFAA